MEKIYYIQKEEFQLGENTNFSPIFYIDYDKAKTEYLKYVEDEIESLDFLESKCEGYYCININGYDKWGKIRKVIYLRSGEINR